MCAWGGFCFDFKNYSVFSHYILDYINGPHENTTSLFSLSSYSYEVRRVLTCSHTFVTWNEIVARCLFVCLFISLICFAFVMIFDSRPRNEFVLCIIYSLWSFFLRGFRLKLSMRCCFFSNRANTRYIHCMATMSHDNTKSHQMKRFALNISF